MLDTNAQKEQVGRWAAGQVAGGMVVGLGSGSTAACAVRALGERARAGLRITGVATSLATEELARAVGIPVAPFDEQPRLDLAIDGADEVDPRLDLVKGLGGALLREKLVELAAAQLLIIVDESKPVSALGERAPLPVEIVPFGWRRTHAALEALGCTAVLRGGPAAPYLTDGGHFLLDCRFGPIAQPAELAARIKALPGVVEHGLFLDMAGRVAVGQADGSVAVRLRQPTPYR
jgi:ribose 5-phosphate isomerase A